MSSLILTFQALSQRKVDTTKDIMVTKEFTISSSVQNVVLQTYSSKVTGKIKNNTNKTLNNVILKINVKTDVLQHTGTLTVNVGTLNPNQEFSINDTVSTNENFETVSSIQYQINGGTFVTIANGNNLNGVPWWTYLIVAICFALAIAAVIKRSKKDNETICANETASNNEIEEETTNINNELENKKLENEKKKLELGIQQVNLDMNKLKLEQQKLEKSKPIYCQYCGKKNDSKNDKCSSCGGPL